MKTFYATLIAIFFMSSFATAQKTETIMIKASYIGKSTEAVLFNNLDTGAMIGFPIVSVKALSKFDLNNKELIGKEIALTYRIDYIHVSSSIVEEKGKAEIAKLSKQMMLIDIAPIEEFKAPVKEVKQEVPETPKQEDIKTGDVENEEN